MFLRMHKRIKSPRDWYDASWSAFGPRFVNSLCTVCQWGVGGPIIVVVGMKRRRLKIPDMPCMKRVYIPGHTLHDLSNPKPGHTTGGSGRGCAHGGAAGRAGPGRTERRRNGSPREEPSSDALANQRQTLWTSLRKHEQRKSYVNRWGEQNPRFISGTRSALCSWLLASVPTPICLCKPFSCRACPGKRVCRYK